MQRDEESLKIKGVRLMSSAIIQGAVLRNLSARGKNIRCMVR